MISRKDLLTGGLGQFTLTGPLALIALASCGPSNAAAPMIRDSASVKIIENASLSDGENGYTIDTIPVFDVGGSESGEDVFRERRGNPLDPEVSRFQIWVMQSGKVVIIHPDDYGVRLYDSTGKSLELIGRKGDGPGEFQWIGSGALLPGDTILVFDVRHRRFSWFSPAGDLVRDTTLVPPMDDEPIFQLRPYLWLSNGTIVLRNKGGTPTGDPGIHRDSSTIAFADKNGVATTPRFKYPDHSHTTVGNGTDGSPLFGPTGFLAAWNTLLIVGDNATFGFDAYNDKGQLVKRIRKTYTPRPVTNEAISTYVAALAEHENVDQVKRGEWLADELAKPHNQNLPAYDRIVVAENGEVWVRDYDLYFDRIHRGRYTVFDNKGVAKTTVLGPTGLDIRAISHDRVIGLWRDSNDVLHVRAYRLRRSK